LGCALRVDVFRSPFATSCSLSYHSLIAGRHSLPFLALTGGSCSCTTEDFLNEFGCSGEQPSSFILHDQNLNEFGSAGALLEGRAPARPKIF
jgi:hypothetical protein